MRLLISFAHKFCINICRPARAVLIYFLFNFQLTFQTLSLAKDCNRKWQLRQFCEMTVRDKWQMTIGVSIDSEHDRSTSLLLRRTQKRHVLRLPIQGSWILKRHEKLCSEKKRVWLGMIHHVLRIMYHVWLGTQVRTSKLFYLSVIDERISFIWHL
jgi:hypothetical protein